MFVNHHLRISLFPYRELFKKTSGLCLAWNVYKFKVFFFKYIPHCSEKYLQKLLKYVEDNVDENKVRVGHFPLRHVFPLPALPALVLVMQPPSVPHVLWNAPTASSGSQWLSLCLLPET